MRRYFHPIALLLVLIAELPILIPPPFGLTDHLVFWKAGNLILTGASPYDMANWAEAQRVFDSAHLKLFVELPAPVWVYPAWTAFLFAPFGWLPYPAGPWALYLAYLAVGLFAMVLFVRSLPSRWQPGAEISIVLAAMFQPLVIANRYGQFGAFLLLGVVLVFRGLRDRSTLGVAAGALLLFTKPQLFVALVPVVIFLLVRQRAWRIVSLTSASLALVAIATTLRYPESLAFFVRGAGDRTAVFTTYSSTWAFAQHLFGPWWPIAGFVLVAATVLLSIIAVRSLPADLREAGMVAAATLISLVITPVDFHYDQAPLLLAVALTIAVGRRLAHVALTWIVALVAPWAIFFAELAIGGADSQSLSGIVPVLVAVLFALVASSSTATSSAPADAGVPRRQSAAARSIEP